MLHQSAIKAQRSLVSLSFLRLIDLRAQVSNFNHNSTMPVATNRMISCWIVVFSLTAGVINGRIYTVLGRGFYIPKFKLDREILSGGASIFSPLPNSCFQSEPNRVTRNEFTYYDNTAAVMSQVGASVGLGPKFQSIFSLELTLNAMTKRVSQQSEEVSGGSITLYSLSSKDYLTKDCINRKNLHHKLESDFKELNRVITKPDETDSWGRYDNFIKKYGTHFVEEIEYGTSLTQNTFSKSSENYSKKDFSLRACADLAGLVKVGTLGFSACPAISRENMERARSFVMSSDLFLKGGSTEVRNKLSHHRTSELLEEFMNEGETINTPVMYKFSSIHDLLMSRFAKTEYVIQAYNLKSYIEGFLNFGCREKRTKGGMILQRFVHKERGSRNSSILRYACLVADEGCYQDSDCTLKYLMCKCDGPTCIKHKTENIFVPPKLKITAKENTDPNWRKGSGCSTLWPCTCDASGSRRPVETWPSGISKRDARISTLEKYFMEEILKSLVKKINTV